jgi:hypothetical protein
MSLIRKPTDLGDLQLRSLDLPALQRIEAGLVEHDRALSAFGRTNSQTTTKLMSLTMLSEGPYRRLRQCLAEIDKRRLALHEAQFALRRKRIEASIKRRERADADDDLARDLIDVDVDELEHQISETQRVAEGALKDIAGLQEAYDQIRTSHGIPERWDEADFEAAEVRAHVLSAFRLAFADVLERGTLSRSAIEYLGQFGIHPYAALTACRDYLAELDRLRQDGQAPTIGHWYAWLDTAADRFGDGYKQAMARIGLTDLVTEWCQYRDTLSR